jgi:replicative DNA helicase
MNPERAILSKAIQTGQIEKLIRTGVDEEHFLNTECRDVWRTCVDHTRRFKVAPSFDAIRKTHPDFGFEVVTDAMDYVVEEFQKQVKRRHVINGLRDIARVIDEQPEQIPEIEQQILELGNGISTLFPSSNVARFSEMQDRISAYEKIKDSGIVNGIPMGIPPFDEMTFGIHNHEFVCIVGWQGTGKSTLAQKICFSAYCASYTPLIISLEMEAEALLRRFDVMATNFSYRALKAAELGEKDMAAWQAWAERASKVKDDIIILDDVRHCTVEKVYAIAEQYRPDLLVIDYLSLMDVPSSHGAMWEKVTYLTGQLKKIARDKRCPPILGIAQTNIGSADDGARLENIAYSRSIGQDADIILGLYQDKDGKMKARNQMEVRMLKNRDGPTTETKMFWNPNNMLFREWGPADMFGIADIEGKGKEDGPQLEAASTAG